MTGLFVVVISLIAFILYRLKTERKTSEKLQSGTYFKVSIQWIVSILYTYSCVLNASYTYSFVLNMYLKV